MKLVAVLMVIMALTNCGKKIEDSGPQFALDLNASQENLKDGVITREDENSGPSYSLSSSNLQSIEYLDKKVVCGNFIISAKRTLKTDIGFQSFKISEAEFHGLNQLPRHPTCSLQLTATNSTGSTVTKNIPLQLTFNSAAPLQTPRYFAGVGHYNPSDLVGPNQFVTESYEISNPLPYDVSFMFNPGVSAQVWAEFLANPSYATCSHSPANITAERILFEPSIEYSGNALEGFLFKVKAGQSVNLLALGHIPDSWVGTRVTRLGTFRLHVFTVSAVSILNQSSLFQGVDFEINPHDLQTMEPVTLTRTVPIKYMKPYNPTYDPAIDNCTRNPEL